MRKFLAIVLVIFVAIVATIGYQITQSDPADSSSPKPSASVPQGDGLDGYYAQQLEWSDCSDGFECATFTVPIDYANPADGAMEISAIRKLATGTALGSLVLNPGGPGGSGIEYTTYVEYVVSETLLENFDIVGFDPRGVGESTPVE